jgi:cell division septation protein DedD
MKRFAMALALAAAVAWGTAAAQSAKVEAVQYPAWLERGGNTVPLAPGIELEARDKVRTGAAARVVLRFREGSTVKLGENARFEIERQHRDITIKVTNITAGIRGTDVWGKSTQERDLVCLLEGQVNVSSEGGAPVTLDKPLDFYQKPRGGEAQVARVDPKQVEIWSAETEIAPDGPAARVGGDWRVIASKFERRDAALALSRRLRSSGYPAHVVDEENGVFVVQIAGLAGESEARSLMAKLRGIAGVTIPSVAPIGRGG